jgi:site-specific DNA recombinase
MRIAIYVRVSSQRQAQTQTIEQQITRLQAHCQAQGWPWLEENIFRDDGFSGSSLSRPGLDRLRDQVKQAAFDQVILTNPDRLARNYVHQMLLIEEFERSGCKVEFVERPMSQDPHDQLLLQIRGAVAEYERSLISERMRRGRQQKFQAGTLLPWTRTPYGYRPNPDRPRDPAGIRVEPSEAAVVSYIYETYRVEGQSLHGLTKNLIGRQILSPSGRALWSASSVREILTNPVYTGTLYAGRTRPQPSSERNSALKPVGHKNRGRVETDPADWLVVGQIEAIVSKEQFEAVQLKLSRGQQFAQRNNTAHQYLLRCLISCGHCRLASSGRTSNAKAYYACTGKMDPIHSGLTERCSSRFIPADQLDALVWQDLCEILTNPGLIEQALHRAQHGEWLPQELQARRAGLRKAETNLTNQLERLTEAYLAQVLSLDEYKRRRADIEQRQTSLVSQIKQLEVKANQQIELAGLVNSIEDFCRRISTGLGEASFEQKRQLVTLLIDRVIVKDEEVEIRYAVPTSSPSESIRFCHLRTDYLVNTCSNFSNPAFLEQMLILLANDNMCKVKSA